jgi:hypothetical protein
MLQGSRRRLGGALHSLGTRRHSCPSRVVIAPLGGSGCRHECWPHPRCDLRVGVVVKVWPAKHPRFHLHYTPTSSSWLNLVEWWFREVTDKAIRRGVFHSVPDLIAAIEEYMSVHNDKRCRARRRQLWVASQMVAVAEGRERHIPEHRFPQAILGRDGGPVRAAN